jgi:hypothetical protein
MGFRRGLLLEGWVTKRLFEAATEVVSEGVL